MGPDTQVTGATPAQVRDLAQNVVPREAQPLRERREDIPALIDHFVRTFAEANRKPITGLTRSAQELLLRYDYPGNVR